jgi:S-methylmethionine-dependent homocysteine/selenocysteine methylase
MPQYRDHLPQLDGDLFLTDGGIETSLIFHDGFDLPEFAAFDLLGSDEGRDGLLRYFRRYAAIARDHGVGFVLESATWRASPDWGKKLGYSTDALAQANHQAIDLMTELRREFATARSPMVISGCVGPRGDGYSISAEMTEDEAEAYHANQIGIFADTEADMVTAVTMTYTAEAIGVSRAARAAGLPVVISFTTETDGRLPSGEALGAAIESVDDATDGAPAYYMINCAHPTHFEDALHSRGAWRERIRALRANASTLSHAELDEAEELDDGDPVDFGLRHGRLVDALPHLNVIGGCCGTDHRHVREVARACGPVVSPSAPQGA